MNTFETISKARYSSRNYDPTRPVTAKQIMALIEAAHLSPSCYNDQPWYFILCNKETHPKSYEKVLGALVEFNQNWAKNAPLLIVSVADTLFMKDKKNNRWGHYDTGAAAVSMMYEATSLGLNAHQMGGFDEKKIQSEFKIPSRYIPMAVMAVGYTVSNEKPAPKDRRPIHEQFFEGAWACE